MPGVSVTIHGFRSRIGGWAVPQEIELKLSFDSQDSDRLAGAALLTGSPAPVVTLDAVYYDTGDHALRAAGYSLRVRREDGRHVQTIKAAGNGAGLFVRREWERAMEGETPVLDPVADPLHEAVGAALLDDLRPVFRTDVLRERRIVERDGARIEIAIDTGEVLAGDCREPLCELELELLSGDAHALFAAARELDAAAPLRLSVLSKPERGYRLAAGKEERAIKAEVIDLSSETDAGMAFVRIARNCIRQFRLNEDIFLDTASPESLHQLRVALRRLRSAFMLFRPILKQDPAYPRFVAALKELGAVTGELRDIDVLAPRLSPKDRKRMAAARAEALEKVEMTLHLARTRHLMLDLAEWLALAEWRSRMNDAALVVFAAAALRRCRRRLKRAAKGWADLDTAGRHEVRKRAKALRYAVEFFASLFTEGKAGKRLAVFREALADLQDELGALNDLAFAPALLERLGMTGALAPPPEREQQALIDAAGRKLSALLGQKRFWT